MLLWVVSGTILIVIIYFPTLFKYKWWNDIGLASFFLIAGVALETAKTFHVDIPNPLNWIIKIHQPLENAISFILGEK